MKHIARFIFPILVLALGVGAFWYFKNSREKAEPIERAVRLPVVSAMKVAKQTASPTLTLFGQVEAPGNSVLSAGITGDVVEVRILEGSKVSQGELLVRLDDADVALDILQREAEVLELEAQIESDRNRVAADKAALFREKALLALARKSVERAKKLAKSRAGSEATLDMALQQEQQQLLAITQRQQSIDDFPIRQKQFTAKMARATAALKRAKRDLERTRINAPYDGRVTDVMVSVGDRAGIGAALVTLYDDTGLEVRTQIPSRYLAELQRAADNNNRLKASLKQNGQKIELELARLSGRISQGQGGVDAFFVAPGGGLPTLGKTVEVELVLPARDDVVVLSTDSLYGASKIYRIEDGVLRGLTINRVGQRFDEQGRQELIVDGVIFAPDDLILDSRLSQAIDGLEVEVKQ